MNPGNGPASRDYRLSGAKQLFPGWQGILSQEATIINNQSPSGIRIDSHGARGRDALVTARVGLVTNQNLFFRGSFRW